MVDYAGNAIPAAGFNRTTNVPDDELLYSYAGFTQKGVQLKAGQGVLLLGTVLARETDTKKYVKFVQGGGNGTGTAVGVLRKTVDTGSSSTGQEYMANVVIAGILKLAKVSAANGGTSNVTTALNARTDAVFGTFKF